jgi:hypothetical protein
MMRTWSSYHWTRSIVENLSSHYSLMAYYHWLGLVKQPAVQDEREWCEWLQRNLNHGSMDPAAGQYSIEVVVGWSRARILRIVVIPFVLFLSCTTTFALLWSVTLGAHHGNVSAGFSIASYFAGLAGGELPSRCLNFRLSFSMLISWILASVALVGFFGGSLAYK